MTEDKISATIMVAMSYQLARKWLPLSSACWIESQRSTFHPQSITRVYNDSIIQYKMPTSQATISNPFDIESSANGSISVFLFNVVDFGGLLEYLPLQVSNVDI